jgi:predicted Rossmann fold flavoprotein
MSGATGGGVLVIEKTPRTGTKVLASGGTRCNVTTTHGPDEAARLFGTRGERFLRHGFRQLTPQAVRQQFEDWGVAMDEAPLDKIFPASGNARDVRDALESAARAGAEIALGSGVEAIGRDGDVWAVITSEGTTYRGRALVLAAGGKSYPLTGTTGDGYAWLRELGLDVVDPVPALVPLASPETWVHELTGLAWQGGEATLEDAGGKVLQRRRRPLLFTHKGLSGPAAMDVSHHVAREAHESGSAKGYRVRFDFFPDLSREEIRAELVKTAGVPGNPRLQRTMASLATGPMARRMFDAVATSAGIDPGVTVGELQKSQRHGLIEALKGLPIAVTHPLGWDQAEVTGGGLNLKALNPRTMAVNGHDGLFVIGELLDVNGPIGGLSFQAAFATAELCAAALGQA